MKCYRRRKSTLERKKAARKRKAILKTGFTIFAACISLIFLSGSHITASTAAIPDSYIIDVVSNVVVSTVDSAAQEPELQTGSSWDAADTTLFSVTTSDLTICWDDAELSLELATELENITDMFDSQGYRVSFLLYDLNSGQGISYCSSDSYYSASTIKGPYVVCLAETIPSVIIEKSSIIEETIHNSNNDGYHTLWNTYGSDVFNTWLQDAGCNLVMTNNQWTDITAQQLGLMWVEMYEYFENNTEDSCWLASVFTDTLNSYICETFCDTYVVYSKAGWINESEYYCVQNDAGIVWAGDNPYVLVVLSNAYERMDLLDPLIETIDDAHTYLVALDD